MCRSRPSDIKIKPTKLCDSDIMKLELLEKMYVNVVFLARWVAKAVLNGSRSVWSRNNNNKNIIVNVFLMQDFYFERRV